ncbi:MAG: hypothetical protein AB8F74_22780 [Saprospiraceae bacterium]
MEKKSIDFDKVLHIFLSNKNKSNEQLFEDIFSHYPNANLTFEIFLFFPISLNRMIFEKKGVDFPNYYFEYDENDNLIGRKRFSENRTYNLILGYSESLLTSYLTQNDFYSIIKRSSEFNAINKALIDESKLSSIQIMPMKIYR